MDECPSCGKYEMSYWTQYEEWRCFACDYKIHESREKYNERLLANNRQRKYYVEPPRR